MSRKTFNEQIAEAQREVSTWPQVKIDSCKLEGSSYFTSQDYLESLKELKSIQLSNEYVLEVVSMLNSESEKASESLKRTHTLSEMTFTI